LPAVPNPPPGPCTLLVLRDYPSKFISPRLWFLSCLIAPSEYFPSENSVVAFFSVLRIFPRTFVYETAELVFGTFCAKACPFGCRGAVYFHMACRWCQTFLVPLLADLSFWAAGVFSGLSFDLKPVTTAACSCRVCDDLLARPSLSNIRILLAWPLRFRLFRICPSAFPHIFLWRLFSDKVPSGAYPGDSSSPAFLTHDSPAIRCDDSFQFSARVFFNQY